MHDIHRRDIVLLPEVHILEKFIQLADYITNDMMEPIGYLPWGILSGCICLAVLFLTHLIRGTQTDRTTIRKDILTVLLIAYLAVLLKLALFSREPGSRTTISLQLFETWGTTMQEHAFFVENILMFIPFGILIPTSFSKMRGIIRCTAMAFACSVLLETIQHLTGRGFSQVDDVITNTLGGLIGYIIYQIWRNFRKGISQP